ncbi:MAG: C40 family peptidase [Candidatus Obscuribacterales bacterium]|nr:C40 family peptidase [Candidatus Obscuribacterales bacterium]
MTKNNTAPATTKTFSVAKNVINLYSLPDTSSEVVTQAIFGERLTVEKIEADFVYCIGVDRYKGWANLRYLLPANESTSQARDMVCTLFADVYSQPDEHADLITKLVISTVLNVDEKPEQADFISIKLPGSVRGFIPRNCVGQSVSFTESTKWQQSNIQERENLIIALGEDVANTAKRFIGVPYLWGGCSPFGIDCSGLVQIAYKLHGVQLLRDADLQFADRRFVKIEEGKSFDQTNLLKGDLAVFGTANNINHIGIALGDGHFVHASGRQNNLGTYINSCSDAIWRERYIGAVRLSTGNDLSIDIA